MSSVLKLSQLATISAGQGAPQGADKYSNSGTPFIKAGDLLSLINGQGEESVQKVSEKVAESHRLKLFPSGTVLFAKSGMSCMKGYVYVLKKDCYVVSHLACITPQSIEPEYLRYYFEYHKPNFLVKDAAYPSISLTDIGAIDIVVPESTLRSRIINILSSIDRAISYRQKELLDLEQLVKSRFIELFGDPLLDDDRYPKVPLGTLAEVGSSKRIFEKEYVSEGVPFYRTKEIVELSKGNRITTELFITRDRYDEIRDEYGVPQKGDLLISAVGTIGVIWIVDGKNDFYFKDGNLLRVAATERFAPTYIKHLLEALIGAYKQEMSSGTAYAALTISALKDMLVYEVPITEQEQFAAFVEQTDKSKLAVQQGLQELEILKKSLMQQYFG